MGLSQVLDRCRALAPWGLVTAIDLGGCDSRSIRDAGQIQRLAIALCDTIQMRRLGDPVIVRFGDESRIGGYSLAQRTATGLISGHFDEQSNRAYIDIFSRTPYPPYWVAEFCRGWFGAGGVRVSIALRQTEEYSVDAISYG